MQSVAFSPLKATALFVYLKVTSMLLKLSPIFVNISLLQSLCSLYDLLLLFITMRHSFENTLVFWVLLVGE